MKPVDMTDFRRDYGDCFRACAASIFEMQTEDIPNVWEKTQDAREWWKETNKWFGEHLGVRVVTFGIAEGMEYFVEDLLCIATGTQGRSDQEHAVVWKNGMIHDPHPSRAGINGKPSCFTVFVPIGNLTNGGK